MILDEFIGEESPPYAVLSHTWEEEEVSFRDFTEVPELARKKKGYAKIKQTCKLALDETDPIEYAWVDTCCIDKSSSAELTEAINSMYGWYARSRVCYVYLSDLAPATKTNHFGACRWFTRGWTLQELVAPHNVLFYDRDWRFRGNNVELEILLSDITGIDRRILRKEWALDALPVATRMSWASRRNTTRLEDGAYSLLGIFDVNMPLIYGEGAKAFERLQHEIIRNSGDLSIFAWEYDGPGPTQSHSRYRETGRFLALSPQEFSDSYDLEFNTNVPVGRECVITSRGLRISRPILHRGTGADDFVLLLHCLSARNQVELLGLRLSAAYNGRPDYFPFVHAGYARVVGLPAVCPYEKDHIYISHYQARNAPLPNLKCSPQTRLRFDGEFETSRYECVSMSPASRWSFDYRAFIFPHGQARGVLGRLVFETKATPPVQFAIIFDLDGKFLLAKESDYPDVFGSRGADDLQTALGNALGQGYAKGVQRLVLGGQKFSLLGSSTLRFIVEPHANLRYISEQVGEIKFKFYAE
jgi:hypothetical protein